MIRLLTGILLLSLLTGCALFKGGDDEDESEIDANQSAEKLYNQGKNALGHKNYESAIEVFETLESRYPFGDYAQQAQLEIAYAYYKQQEPDAAIAAADQFIRLNPRHPHIDYAYYLKGLADFHRHSSIFDKFINRDISGMDPAPLENAFLQFKLLVERFPDSRYAEDARLRMIHLRNLLAAHEIRIAKFYQKREAWAAVAKRASYVVEHYQGAVHVPEALSILADAYDRLGLKKAQAETLKILELNFPPKETPTADEPEA